MMIGVCGSTSGKTSICVPQNSCTTERSTVDRPMVTMITLMIGSPMSGRRTTRSMARPSSTEKPSVSRKER